MPRTRRLSPALCAASIAAMAAAAMSASPAAADPLSYVALGDSFQSGPGIPTQVNVQCGRSDHNYAHLAAAATGVTLTDVTCGGARIKDMTESQYPGTPPQFDALKADTDVVTVGIGGNDLPFAEVVLVCGSMGAFNPFGKPCTDYYNPGGKDELLRRMNEQLLLKLTAVVDAIQAKSPQARVLFVGVPSVVPESGSCWGPNNPVAAGDYPYLVKVTKNLNATFAKAAANAGGEYVDIYPNSLGHDICKPAGTRWVEGVFPGDIAAPVHPNGLGMKGAAQLVTAAIG